MSISERRGLRASLGTTRGLLLEAEVLGERSGGFVLLGVNASGATVAFCTRGALRR